VLAFKNIERTQMNFASAEDHNVIVRAADVRRSLSAAPALPSGLSFHRLLQGPGDRLCSAFSQLTSVIATDFKVSSPSRQACLPVQGKKTRSSRNKERKLIAGKRNGVVPRVLPQDADGTPSGIQNSDHAAARKSKSTRWLRSPATTDS
jgi:hypothetical protein